MKALYYGDNGNIKKRVMGLKVQLRKILIGNMCPETKCTTVVGVYVYVHGCVVADEGDHMDCFTEGFDTRSSSKKVGWIPVGCDHVSNV